MSDPWAEAAKAYKPQPGQAPEAAGNDDWKVWQTPDTPPPTQQAPQTILQRAFGTGPSSTLSSVGSHLANMVTGPYHAFADAPRNPQEQQIKGTNDSSGPISNALGQFGLGAARMFVEPTMDAGREAIKQAKAGNIAGKEYDAQGNYSPNALGSAMDAVPIAGQWARSVETEAHQKGALPALAGMATDIAAPVGAGKIAKALRGAAPGLAEGALNISKTDRAFNKTPGRAILDETTGVRPETVQNSARGRVNELSSENDQMASSHNRPVDITPAVDYVNEATNSAKLRNNLGGVNALEPVKNQLTENPFKLPQAFASPMIGDPNAVLSPMQTASGALNLKRGLRDQFVKSWNPDAGPQMAKDVARGASGVIDSQLDRALGPDFASNNQRISSLIPVMDAAESVQRNAGVAQRLAGRFKAHTGALAGGIGGALAGSAHGPFGAIGGGLAGLIAPEVVGSPTIQMGLARALDSKIPTRIAPVAASGGIMTPRRK